MSLVSSGAPKASLVVPADAPKCVQIAAKELARWTKELTGAELPVGETAREGLVPVTWKLGVAEGVRYDGFSVTASEKGVAIAAEDPFGIVYSTYWMLNRFGKMYWFDPESGVDFVKTDSLALPLGTRVEVPIPDRNPLVPGLPDPPSVSDLVAEWNVRNGFQPRGGAEKWGLRPLVTLGGHCLGDMIAGQSVDEKEVDAEVTRIKAAGEAAKFLNPPHDKSDRMIRLLAKYNLNVKRHPEMFPLIDGQRCPSGVSLRGPYKGKVGNPCLSNPATRAQLLKTIVGSRTKAAEKTGGRIRFEFGFMCDDNSQWCECDDCMKLLKSKGAGTDDDRASDYWWDFCNWMAPRLLEDPDTSVDTALYLTYRQMPKKVKPLVVDKARQSVLVCPHGRCYFHPLAGGCKPNVRFEKMFREWIDVGMPVRVFEYHCQLPGKGNYAFFEKSWLEDLKWYRANGVTYSSGGLWGVWGGYPHVPGLNKNQIYRYGAKARWQFIYLSGHFSWDTDDDIAAVTQDVLMRYYRGAAKEMLAYHKLLEEAIFRANICMSYGSSGLPFTVAASEPGLLDKAKTLLSAADAKAVGDKELQKRLARDRQMLALDWESAAAAAGSVTTRRLFTATDTIKLDGVVDEATWKGACVSDDWRWLKTYNVDNAAPDPFKPHTKMLTAADNENLYLAFICDIDPKRPDVDVAPSGKTFEAMDGSHLEICVQSPSQNGEYFHLALSRNGKTYSAQTSSPTERDLKKKCNFTFGIRTEATRWTAELALPLKDFGALPKDGEVWRVCAYRDTPGWITGSSTGFPLHWMDRWEAFAFGWPGNMVQNASFEKGRPAPYANYDGKNWPFAIVRSYGTFATNAVFTRELVAAQERHPGLVDEVWEGGGDLFCSDEAFERDVVTADADWAVRLGRIGIARGYQQGLTLGHDPSDRPCPGFVDTDWAVEADGNRVRGMLCPTAPATFAANRRQAERVMSRLKPVSYWPDDDLRYSKRNDRLCFCDRCLAAFNARTGACWTRPALVEALYGTKGDRDVREAWIAFNRENLGRLAKVYREAADAVLPTCRLGIQLVQSYADYNGRDFRPLVEALSGPAGRKVGLRPGACAYTDRTPRDILRKALYVMNEAARSRTYGCVGQVCYEAENWPHVAAEKNPSFQMTECALALAAGCDSLALYWGAGRDRGNREEPETHAWYFETFAKWKPFLLAVRDGCRGTEPCGLAEFRGSDEKATDDWRWRDDDVEMRLMENALPLSVPDALVEAHWLSARRVAALAEKDLSVLFARPVLADVPALVALRKKFPHVRSFSEIGSPSPDTACVASRTAFGGTTVVAHDLATYWLWTGPDRAAILDALDKAIPGRATARLLTGGCCVTPIVRTDGQGRVRGVFLLNVSPGETPPLKLAVRRPAGLQVRIRTAEGAGAPTELASRDGESVVGIPSIGGWRPLWVEFGE